MTAPLDPDWLPHGRPKFTTAGDLLMPSDVFSWAAVDPRWMMRAIKLQRGILQMTVHLYVWTDELYPYWRLEHRNVAGARPIELSEADYAAYEKVRADFFNWQAKLKDLRK